MATIVEMINPLTGLPEQVDQLDHTAQEIDDAVALALPGGYYDKWVSQLVNPNLLDNWYFGNPVNQRGQTEYTGNVYCIDRWFLPGCNCSLVDDGLLITTTAQGQVFKQAFPQEMQTALSGKTVTFSVLATIKSGEFYLTDTGGFSASHADAKMQTGLTSWTFSVANFNSIAGLGWWGDSSGAQILVHAAKLELGTQQTLAHQDENGVWQLNEIPNYGEQLRRCQRYDYIIGRTNDAAPVGLGTAYSDTAVLAVIELPETMRANPAVSITGLVNLRFSESKNISVSSVSNYGFSGDKVQLFFSGLSGLTQGQSCDIYVQRGSKMEFNANL